MYEKKYNILFPLESSGRELEYKTILASNFANKGHDCYIGEKPEIYKLIDKLKPIIYFDKGYHKEISEKIYDNLKRKNAIIINLDEEGAVDYSDNRTLFTRYPKKNFENLDLIFLWGAYQFKVLKEKYNFKENKNIVISGHPRFQLLKNQSILLNSNILNQISKKYGKYVLITSNCSIGNNLKGEKFVLSNYAKRIPDIEQVILSDKKKIDLLIKFTVNYAKESGSKIIFRPHPEENFETYKNAFKDYNNIIINCDFSSILWIYNADLIVHPDCTTGIEASILGKNVISLLPKLDNKYITEIPVKMSVLYSDPYKLSKDLIENKIKFYKAGIEKIKNDYFSIHLDTINIIVNSVQNLLENRKVLKGKYLNILNEYNLKILHILKLIKIKNKINFQFAKQKRNNFDKKNIKVILDLIPDTNNVLVREINKGLFKFFIKQKN